MTPRWESREAWASRYMPDVRRKLSSLAIKVATPEQDMQQATDLILLPLPNGGRIACRMRTHKYLDRYGDEFTIRSHLDNGAATELQKILAGFGDYLFYGFAAPGNNNGTIAAARLIDLNVFRVWHTAYNGKPPHKDVLNHDGTSGRAYSVRDAPAELVFHEWGHVAVERQLSLLGAL